MRINEAFSLRRMGNEEVLIANGLKNIDFTKIMVFNDTASWLWKKIQHIDFSVEYIQDLLLNENEVDPEIAKKDSENFVKILLESGIIDNE